MREILFRGKRLDNKAWETGGLVPVRAGRSDERFYIADKMTGYQTQVDSGTIGQYTGLTDKNGTMIFEGDILRGAWDSYIVVYYDDCYLGFRVRNKSGLKNDVSYYNNGRIEVVGNVHDNPTLLLEK